VSALARDAAGNTTHSVATVTVSNIAPPSVPGGATPFLGRPFLIPGRIQAEDFDHGGEGVAYHDLTPANQGAQYRTDTGVDIIAATSNSLGYVLSNMENGEWLSYTINVRQSGHYRIQARTSSEFNDSRWRIEIDGVDVTGPIDVPNTGWWGTFRWSGKDGVHLTAGQHVLRIVAERQYFNLDAIRIVRQLQ
jgi:chitinase